MFASYLHKYTYLFRMTWPSIDKMVPYFRLYNIYVYVICEYTVLSFVHYIHLWVLNVYTLLFLYTFSLLV